MPRDISYRSSIPNIRSTNATVLERFDTSSFERGSRQSQYMPPPNQHTGNNRLVFGLNADHEMVNFEIVERILNSVRENPNFTTRPDFAMVDPGERLSNAINQALTLSSMQGLNVPSSLYRLGRANAIVGRRVPESSESAPDPSVPCTSPSIQIKMVFRQMLESIGEIRGALPQFSNAISHMPDIGGVKSVSDLVTILERLEELMQTSSISEDSWKRDWNVFFVSLREHDSGAMPISDCCVCMESRPAINVCDNAEQAHLLCSECLLNHYWVNTVECTKSTAACPLCRSPIKITEIVERISTRTNRNVAQPIQASSDQAQGSQVTTPSEDGSEAVRATIARRRVCFKRPVNEL